MDYSRICFVIMPFGEKAVGDKTVDFDAIYDTIFAPAINAVPLPEPEQGKLEARRTDRDFFAGDISHEMFNYLEYSRIALADITGLNANVFYELGHRHRARESGTAIFRQTDAPIPFDVNQIKSFPYEYFPESEADQARDLIRRVLTESLGHNRPDSPVRRALAMQKQRGGNAEELIREAENALRNQDPATAVLKYTDVVAASPDNHLVRLGLGLLLKNRGDWDEALEQFTAAIALAPDYAEAYREKGIAENKLYRKTRQPPDGEEALRKATQLNPQDFDALASLGGVLKRRGDSDGALEAYRESARVSRGHSYPLLNALTLEAAKQGRLEIDAKAKLMLRKAGKSRQAQAASDPPYDAPWSHFDVAQIQLYLGDVDAFTETVDEALLACEHAWQAQTFRDTLAVLTDAGVALPGLTEGIARLDEMIPLLE
ncbi:MAG: tetratricopeptide repeat protein [Gammaproteobacteria bacterium]|nr:tetratricopeptide repeat protein [Gammaproteobacteria bacterium]